MSQECRSGGGIVTKRDGRENHHVNPKQKQRQTIGVVIDDATLPLEREFHHKITNQIVHDGVPTISTVGEIDIEDIHKGRYPRVKEHKKR
jgi:hypothetical protein